MIGRLSGILLEKNPPQLLVDCGGVGYEVDVSMSTYYNLPGLGEKVVLFTHQAIREDAHLLFGFGNAEERAVFRRLIKVPGIGKKTAERLLLELKGKLGADLGAGGAAAAPDAKSDILNALMALGYSDKEALMAIKAMPAGSSVSDGIKFALKALSKG